MQHPKIMLPILLFLSFGTALTKKRIEKYAILKIRQEAMEFFFPSPSTKVVIVMSVDSILKIMPLFRKEWYPIYKQEPNMQYLHTKALPKTHLTCLEYQHYIGISSAHGYRYLNINIMTAHSFLNIINAQEQCSHSQKLIFMFL